MITAKAGGLDVAWRTPLSESHPSLGSGNSGPCLPQTFGTLGDILAASGVEIFITLTDGLNLFTLPGSEVSARCSD